MDTRKVIAAIFCNIVTLTDSFLNTFFMHCLWNVQEDLRQPLKFLLIWCLGFSILYHAATTSVIYSQIFNASRVIALISDTFYFTSGCIFIISPTWFSLFYYLSIVPQKSSVMLWAKKNLRIVIYSCTIGDFFLIFSSSVLRALFAATSNDDSVVVLQNWTNRSIFEEERSIEVYFNLHSIPYIIHLVVSFWILALSGGGTFLYLRRHMKNMKSNNGSFSQPQQKSQMRVTILGFVQGLFFLPCCFWVILDAILQKVVVMQFTTVLTCSVLGLVNSVCLGLSQSAFRQEVKLLWKKVRNKLGCK